MEHGNGLCRSFIFFCAAFSDQRCFLHRNVLGAHRLMGDLADGVVFFLYCSHLLMGMPLKDGCLSDHLPHCGRRHHVSQCSGCRLVVVGHSYSASPGNPHPHGTDEIGIPFWCVSALWKPVTLPALAASLMLSPLGTPQTCHVPVSWGYHHLNWSTAWSLV